MLINTGMTVNTKAVINLPAEIGRIMLGVVSSLPSSGLEYGLYLQGTWDAATCTVSVLPDQYYFPTQVVTSTTIEFQESPPGPEWNVVIHRHPHSCRTFSSTDKNSINEEFLASILFIPNWEFPDAIVNMPLAPGVKFQTPATVHVQGSFVDIPDWLQERISTNLTVRTVTVGAVSRAGRGTIQALTPEMFSDMPKAVRRNSVGVKRSDSGRHQVSSADLLGEGDIVSDRSSDSTEFHPQGKIPF